MRKNLLLVPTCAALLFMLVPAYVVHAEEKDEKEGDEVKVKIDQVPAVVRKTLDEESHNAKIDSVDKETDDGKTIYEADVKLNDKNYEIKVAEDGTLISKKLDMEDEKDSKEKK